MEAEWTGFRTFVPGSEQAMICLSVDILVALIFHVTLCLGEIKKRGEKRQFEN